MRVNERVKELWLGYEGKESVCWIADEVVKK